MISACLVASSSSPDLALLSFVKNSNFYNKFQFNFSAKPKSYDEAKTVDSTIEVPVQIKILTDKGHRILDREEIFYSLGKENLCIHINIQEETHRVVHHLHRTL